MYNLHHENFYCEETIVRVYANTTIVKMRNIVKKIDTARSMPPKVLIESATRLAKGRIRRYAIKVHPIKLSDKYFLKATGYKPIDEVLNRNLPPFFFYPKDKEKIVELIKNEYPESMEHTINDADEICEHNSDLLGSGKRYIWYYKDTDSMYKKR